MVKKLEETVEEKPNRELTKEVFEINVKEIAHYTGGNYKPWWSSGDNWSSSDNGNLFVRGYNGGETAVDIQDAIEKAVEDGRIVKNQDYLFEVTIKVTKLKDIDEGKK